MEQRKGKLAACLIGILIAGALGIPALRSLIRSGHEIAENRALAPWPAAPHSIGDLLKYTKQLEPWIDDHFGFRTSLITLYNKLRYAVFGEFPTIQVIAGRDGRIFLSSHAKTQIEYSAIAIPCGYMFRPPEKERVATQFNALHESLQQEGIDARFLIVPSSPVIHMDALPAWLQRRCSAVASPIESTLASPHIHAETRKAIYFPRAEMLALKDKLSIFPKTWFHWAGAGPREVAGLSVKYFWDIGQNTGKPLVEVSKLRPSDISHLFPGINLASEVMQPDHSQSQIEACVGPRCFPALGTVADKLQEIAFYRNPAAPQHRLILLSDSFGEYIAGWYPRYFQEVLYLSTNSLGQLDAAEIRKFKDYIKTQAQTGQVMVLYHDGSAIWNRPGQDQEYLFAKR